MKPRRATEKPIVNRDFRGFVRSIALDHGSVPLWDKHPFDIPALRTLHTLDLDPHVTFFVGENGSGKSTLLEALAVAAGFNAEGGSKNLRFATQETHSALFRHLRLMRETARETDGFFLRAESFYNVASELERLGITRGYGGRPLHAQSHGEAFLSLLRERLLGHGLYLFDEPEAALSPARQMACLVVLHDLARLSSQFVIATHSPIIMAYPGATIYRFSDAGIQKIDYEATEHYALTRRFLNDRQRMLQTLLGDDPPD